MKAGVSAGHSPATGARAGGYDFQEAWLTPEELRGYHKGVIVAYLAREHGKGGDEDIRKAASHFAKLLECLESKS